MERELTEYERNTLMRLLYDHPARTYPDPREVAAARTLYDDLVMARKITLVTE